MCGHFALNETPRKLAERFNLVGDFELPVSCLIVSDMFNRCR